MESKTLRTIGFGMLFLVWGLAFYIIGMFHEFVFASNLLFTMFILGMFTVLGMVLMETTDKGEKEFYHKRKEKEKKMRMEINELIRKYNTKK